MEKQYSISRVVNRTEPFFQDLVGIGDPLASEAKNSRLKKMYVEERLIIRILMFKPTAINSEDFNLLVELAMREEGYSHIKLYILNMII
ncbi:hypothetical protein [Legionella sp. CNM-4043-24]|uniref:hypothetical protein n=1 Tax=Legionella sp. CNM-4043-24 TaxID=3421646 RepID=UPI00403B3293